MKASEVIARARRLGGDAVTPYRWDDADLFPYLNEGEKEIVERRPELLLSSPGELAERETVDAADDTLTVPDSMLMAMAHFVAAMMYLEDSDAAGNDKRYAEQMALFAAQIS